jgi:hypothetical protein
MAHACNPSYSGCRNQQDHGSKLPQANGSVRPYLEKKIHKNRTGRVAQDEGPEFKPQYHTKKCLKILETKDKNKINLKSHID